MRRKAVKFLQDERAALTQEMLLVCDAAEQAGRQEFSDTEFQQVNSLWTKRNKCDGELKILLAEREQLKAKRVIADGNQITTQRAWAMADGQRSTFKTIPASPFSRTENHNGRNNPFVY
jgi:hypothetical protein